MQVFVSIFSVFCEFFSQERENCVNERSEFGRIWLKTTLADFEKSHWGVEKLRLRKNFFEGNFGLMLIEMQVELFEN